MTEQIIDTTQDAPITFAVIPELAVEIRDAALKYEEQGVDPLNVAITVLWMAEALKRDFPWMADIVFEQQVQANEQLVGDENEVVSI